jgi:hypothetical protein
MSSLIIILALICVAAFPFAVIAAFTILPSAYRRSPIRTIVISVISIAIIIEGILLVAFIQPI